eukprot:1808582-Rhodomonas_salina.1
MPRRKKCPVREEHHPRTRCTYTPAYTTNSSSEMWLVKGMPHPSYRINMDSTKYYSTDDLIDLCEQNAWPATGKFLEINANLYIRITTKSELRFAAEAVSRYHQNLCMHDSTYVNTPEQHTTRTPWCDTR